MNFISFLLFFLVILSLFYIFLRIYFFYYPYFPFDESLNNCLWKRWGCCKDNITPKYDQDGTNCLRIIPHLTKKIK